MKSLYFFVLLVSISLIADVDGSWKFWKKDKSTTTETPLISNPQPTVAPGSTTKAPVTPVNTKKALAGVADPGLAIGVGNTGGNIKDNARPQRPNPGTEVGLDIPRPKPGGTGYRDWAVDFTGAGDGRQPPKVPSQGPALSPGQQTRPGSPIGQQPSLGTPTPKPGTPVQTPKPGTPASTPKPGTPVQTPKPGTPVQTPQPGTPSGPGSFGTPSSGSQSPTGSKTYAQAIAGGSKPSSPTPAPKQGVPSPGGTQPGRSQPTPQPGKSGIPAGAAVGAAAGAAGLAVASTAGQKYTANPTFSKGKTITDEDLEKLSEALFIKDVNNAMKYITLNLQKQTSGNSPVDEAPQPLLSVNPQALQIPTIQRVLAIYDNYKLDTRINEHISAALRDEESLLVDTFLSTNVMAFAMRFLADKQLVKKDYYDYKALLRQLWFDLFSRGEGKIGSSGFEHVFMTELKEGTEVIGLHNWIYFNSEESKNANYLGYIKKVDLGDKAAILKVHAKFDKFDKPVTTMFLGTSPELEMSLYTVCFLARRDQACPVSLGGTKFNIKTYNFKYRGKDHVGSAYPEI